MKILCATLTFLATGAVCLAQQKPSALVLKVEQKSSGPSAGGREQSCLLLYSDGRVLSAFSTTAGVEIQDSHGNVTRPQTLDIREYRLPDSDSWEVTEMVELLQSKAVRRLKGYFPPPHRPVDFVEISTVQAFLPDHTTKRIVTREYYVSSLVERTKYPSALVILMDGIERLEKKVAEKGTPTEIGADCKLESKDENGAKK